MNAKKLIALLLTLVMLVGLIPAIPAAAEEIVLDEEATQTQELFTVVGGDFEPDAALFDEEPQPAAPLVDAAALPEARETDGAAEDGDGLAPAETYDTPYEDLPYYAQQSQELIGLEETWVETWDELKTALADPGAMRIKLLENVGWKQTWNAPQSERDFVFEVNGVKALDLHGYTIYGMDDEAHFSTLFHVREGAYLELYDYGRTTGGVTKWGRINYDGYIYESGPARVRNLFQVDGTLLLNGGILETGRAKKVRRYNFIDYREGYVQVIGTAIIVGENGKLIMNSGTVYGRGYNDSAIRLASNNTSYINGGNIFGLEGANAITKNNSLLSIRNGYFSTSDRATGTTYWNSYSGYFMVDDQSAYVFSHGHSYGKLGMEDSVDADAKMTKPEYIVATVTHAREAILDPLEAQTIKSGRPILRVPVPERAFPELEGVYQYAIGNGAAVSQVYSWEILIGTEWHRGRFPHDTPEINVFTEWEDFTPETDKIYNARCTVYELVNGNPFQTVYSAVPFIVQESPRPTIYTDLPDEMSFRGGGTINLLVEAGGDGLVYNWEVRVPERENWISYSGDESTLRISGLPQSWDGYQLRCKVTNAEGGEAVSNVCTLRYDDGTITSIAFTTPHYDTYGEPYVPVGGALFEKNIRCDTQGVTLTGVRWVTDRAEAYTGQEVNLCLDFRTEAYVPVDAEHLTVTLDGVPYTAVGYYHEPEGNETGLQTYGPWVYGKFYWKMTAVSDGDDSEIVRAEIRMRGLNERGYQITDVYKTDAGYRGSGYDADVRYEVESTSWGCDGKPVTLWDDFFLGHANYRMTVILKANEHWAFTDSTVVMLEGEKCEAKLIDSETLEVSRDYYWTEEDDDDFENWDIVIDGSDKPDNSNGDNITGDEDETFSFEPESAKTLIELVSLDGEAPYPFATCADLSPADIGFGDGESSDKRYEVKSTRWFCEGKEMLAGDLSAGYPGNLFVLDKGYEVVVTLTPSQGYKFSAECAAKFGELDMKAARLYDGDLEVTKSWYLDENGQALEKSESYAAPEVIHPSSSDMIYSFGTLTINDSYWTHNTIIENNEDGLVIYLEKDVWLYCTDKGNSALVLNGDTTITGPGRLTILVDDEGTRTSGPAAIQVNGCKLTIRDADLTVFGCTGIRGKTVDGRDAELVIENSTVRMDTALGGVYGFNGGITFVDSEVAEPADWLTESTAGIFRRDVGNHTPFEQVTIRPCRTARSISISPNPGEEEELALTVGQSMNLSATVVYSDSTDSAAAWSSSSPDTVSVDEYGKITGLSDGSAIITATAGGQSASVRVSARTAVIPATGVTLGKSAVTVGENTSVELTAQVLPLNASDKIVRWSISDGSVAALALCAPGDATDWCSSENAVRITGVTPGESATVTVETLDGRYTASCVVNVSADFVGTTGVEIAGEDDLILKPNTALNLSANVLPANASDKTVRWSSSDPEVAAVDEDGALTVTGCGSATIEAAVWHQSGYWVSDFLNVYVRPAATGVSISAPADVLEVGHILRLNAYVYPGNAADRSVIWTSSDEEIATVDANGVVTGVGTWESESASVTITCTTADGGFTDSVGITVNQPPTRVQSLTLSQNELTMPVSGDKSSQRIYIKILPENADETAWTCTVSSPLATASIVHLEDADHNFISGTEPLYGEYCYVVADLTGTANLTFRSVDGGKVARLRVKVVDTDDYIPVESVEVEEFITLGVGQSVSVLPTIEPVNASEKTVLLTSGDLYGEYIRVEDGRIYGVSEGYADVMVTVDGVSTRANGLPAVCNIHVVKPVETLTLDAQVVALPLGGTQRLIATVGPDDAYDKTVTWTSADESVVTVDPDGTLHAVGYGTTYITAETAIFPLSAGCTVTVISNTYDLYIDGTQITDENRVGDNYTYDPSANILTVSGGITSEGGAPAIRSEIDGLTVAFTGEPSLSAAQSALWLEADTTVTGTATLRSTGAVPVYVSNGAALTLDGADLTVIGPSGIHATGTGESLTVINTGLSVSGIVEALGGFDGGITLSGCVLLNGCRVADGGIVTAAGGIANSALIVPTPACGEPDFTLPAMIRTIEDGAFEGIDAEIVYIPDGCTSIGQGAFRNCPSLTQIRIPAGCAIGEGAFDGCGTVYVFAPADSPAQTFCEDPANPNCIFIAE